MDISAEQRVNQSQEFLYIWCILANPQHNLLFCCSVILDGKFSFFSYQPNRTFVVLTLQVFEQTIKHGDGGTLDVFFQILQWSFTALLEGKFPERNWDGSLPHGFTRCIFVSLFTFRPGCPSFGVLHM